MATMYNKEIKERYIEYKTDITVMYEGHLVLFGRGIHDDFSP